MRREPDVFELLDELLEATADTVQLVADLDEPRWRAHTEYLRALQRVGQALLASDVECAAGLQPSAPAHSSSEAFASPPANRHRGCDQGARPGL